MIHIINKNGEPGKVRVKTIDQEAKAGDDYEAVDEIIEFKQGELQNHINVKINDDDNWEPDEDFFVQLIDANTNEELQGKDTRTRVTIIDDDQPGQIAFDEQGTIRAIPTEPLEIKVIRKNGSDGQVTVDFETIQLDQSDQTATAGRDFVNTSGTLTFKHGETEQTITVELLDNGQDVRDETFAVQLSNVAPRGAKLSKKSLKLINIITDQETKKKQEILDQILRKIEDEEEGTWGSQFIKACMLHPAKDEDGEIQDIDPVDGLLHLICIGWKLVFAIVPPPQYLGGWACFVMALVMIGVVTAVVGEFANLFGCVLGIEPAITAITFVALGTSLPDTFASMAAAQADAFADSAVGNVTGSNSVNVFLGLGLPWVIAGHYYSHVGTKDDDTFQYKSETDTSKRTPDYRYFVFAGSLGFSVAVFCSVALACIVFLVIRRKVVGGELGGSPVGRTGSCIFLCCLWGIYILMSILQSSDVGGLKQSTMGMIADPLALHPLKKCNKKELLCATAGKLWDGKGITCDNAPK